jgi:hypothetical protein
MRHRPTARARPCFNMAGDTRLGGERTGHLGPRARRRGHCRWNGRRPRARSDRGDADPLQHGRCGARPRPDAAPPGAGPERQGVFLRGDRLLESLYESPNPLPPGRDSVNFAWQATGVEMGIPPDGHARGLAMAQPEGCSAVCQRMPADTFWCQPAPGFTRRSRRRSRRAASSCPWRAGCCPWRAARCSWRARPCLWPSC